MDYNINKELSKERLKNFRKEKGYTQYKTAEEIEISSVNYAKYECGSRIPSLSKLIELSLLFGKPIECFIYEDRKDLISSAEKIEYLRSLDISQLKAILEQIRILYQAQN